VGRASWKGTLDQGCTSMMSDGIATVRQTLGGGEYGASLRHRLDSNTATLNFQIAREIGIGAAVACGPLPHHRAYGSVHGGSSQLR
jgi:hypothetical protein